MSLYLGDKKMSVYVGDVLVSGGGNECPKLDVLVVGGGGRGAGSTFGHSSRGYYGRCGGDYMGFPGGAILCEGYEFSPYVGPISVTVGRGEYNANVGTHCAENSQFLDLIAYAGCSRCFIPYEQGQLCPSGTTDSGSNVNAYGGFGGAGSAGGNGCICGNTLYGGTGGNGLQSDIDGTMRRYAGGAGGGGQFSCQGSNYSVVLGQHGCGYDWCGGGAHPDGNPGKDGIVVVRYKTDGSCGFSHATGGCKYTCGDYTIHCFTSSDTFCITG